jgi:bifunctional DNA primase/polymerase-like protein
LLVIDIDGEDGRLSWTRLAGHSGGHDSTRIAGTGGGGWHLYFAGDGPSTAGKLGPGIDTRGEAGTS